MLDMDNIAEPIDLWVNSPPPVIGQDIFVQAAEKAAIQCFSQRSGGLYAQNGTPEQRRVVSTWLAERGDGICPNPDDLLLCQGAQQAIQLAFADLARPGGTIASEAHSYTGAIAAAQLHGLGWQAVEHDSQGMQPAALDSVLNHSNCRIVFTTPVCQNPLGLEAGEQRRSDILAVCARHDAFIVEDDIYGIYASQPKLTYKQLAPERVYYVNGLSKCLTPLLRIGVICPPKDRLADLQQTLRAQLFGVSPLALQTGCNLITCGAADQAAARLRKEAQQRCAMAADILELDALPMPEGAPFIWLPLSSGDAASFARCALEAGVLVLPPGATAISPEAEAGVRLAILAPPQRENAAKALRIIADLAGR